MLSKTLIPIVCIILLGFILKRRRFVSEQFWQASDRMVYYVFFPALLVSKISVMDLSKVPMLKISAIIILLLFVFTGLLILIQAIKPMQATTFTSVYQGAVRYNTFIALTLVATVWTIPQALDVAALIVGIKVLFVNILCVSIFAIYLNKSDSVWGKLLLVFKNPLIIACCTGLLLNALSIGLPVWLLSTLDLLGRVALTLGLLSVGAGLILQFNDWISGPIVLSVILKLIIMPLATFGLGYLFSLDTISHQVLVLIFAMPTAISAYILAGQLGGDQRVMAKIITIQTLFSAGTLALILFWINGSSQP